MPRPLAYLITWTTYGTWLPGDERGWVERGIVGIQAGDVEREEQAQYVLTEEPVYLDLEQRRIVEQVIEEHCRYRGWTLRAVNARTNHVHVLITAEVAPERVMQELKSWATRRLKANAQARELAERHRWWTPHGSTKWINNEGYLGNALRYVTEGQDS